jgi:sigma-B regulation protein RsbU (phosphoserine phosphatase)
LCPVEAVWALGCALGSYVVANVFELVIVRWMRPSVPEVVEVSDLILAAAVGVTAYLWLHLRTTRTDLHRLEREQIVVSTQLAAAAEIQRRLLPSEPRTVNGIACAVGFESAWEIGGDFYDFLPIAHDAMLVVIGDISGKGIPAAILLAFVRTALRVAAARTTDPAELLTALSDALYEDNQGTPYATCLVSRVDTQRGTLTYANAGHPPGVIFGTHGLQVLDRGGPPAGMFERPRYVSEMVAYRPGDLAVLVTDGITEKDTQDRPPEALLASLVDQVPPPKTPARVCDAIMTFARVADGPLGIEGWSDDRTVLAFQWAGP